LAVEKVKSEFIPVKKWAASHIFIVAGRFEELCGQQAK
jgi:hypothetical protein